MENQVQRGIRWDAAGAYWINGEKKLLCCGEFHYFRVPRQDWERRLLLWKKAGGNCIATYVPWELHEPQEGSFAFSDCPARDLEGFLQLCRRLDLFVLVRPGPYQYSEMKYSGLPEWLVTEYPQILARNPEGEIVNEISVSYLHPVFLEKARRWYEAVIPILARYTVDNDGPIAMVQFDNELMGIHYWFTDAYDCNRQAMGIGEPGGAWPSFLRERYDTIGSLNAAYESGYGSFEEVFPIHPPARCATQSRRLKDYQDFYFSAAARYAQILCGWLRELGMQVPIVHNSPNPNANSTFLEICEALGEGFLLGSDHYYNLNIGWEQNNPTPQYALRCFYSNEMLRLMGYPPTVFELPGGSPSEFPPIAPGDLKAAYYANTALGMKGHNYYIFTGGENPFHLGSNGRYYDFCAPVSAAGEVRPSYEIIREYHAFLHENEWLAGAGMEADFYVGLDWESTRSSFYSASGVSRAKAWELTRNGILLTAFGTSYSPQLVDLSGELPTDKPLMLAVFSGMERSLQEKLVAFLKAGGKLVLAPTLPQTDETGAPCTVLADFLGSKIPANDRRYAPVLMMDAMQDIPCSKARVYTVEEAPLGARTIGWDEKNGGVFCWEKAFPGGGKAVFLGLDWEYCKLEHGEILTGLLTRCGKPAASRCISTSNPSVWAVLRRNGEKAMAFVLNLYSAPNETDVTITVGANTRTFSDLKLQPMEVLCLPVTLADQDA